MYAHHLSYLKKKIIITIQINIIIDIAKKIIQVVHFWLCLAFKTTSRNAAEITI